MTREQLRVFLQEWFCGCGQPEAAAKFLRDVLAIHPLFDHRDKVRSVLPNDQIEMFVLYLLVKMDLTTHGGSVDGGWLTERGEQVLAALEREAADGFETLMAGNCCIHGYVEGEGCAECGTLMRTPL
jgi:hypothetical protein